MITGDLNIWIRVIIPFLIIGGTLAWWLLIVLAQTPRRFWRDALNVSIVGVLAATSIYILSRAGVRAGFVSIDTQLIMIVGAVFAIIGWPTLARETQRVRDRQRRDGEG